MLTPKQEAYRAFVFDMIRSLNRATGSMEATLALFADLPPGGFKLGREIGHPHQAVSSRTTEVEDGNEEGWQDSRQQAEANEELTQRGHS